MLPSLGKAPAGSEKKKVQQSPNYRNGQFQNTVPTPALSEGHSFIKVFFKFINKPKICFPPQPLPAVKTNLHTLPADKPVVTWFGHSSYLIKINNRYILVDPVFSGYAAPLKGLNKAFAGSNIYSVEDLPDIDLLLITHDHYDHLDYETILKLKSKVKHVCTSLGVAAHLLYWGYVPSQVQELDWHQSATFFSNITFTAVPARHFSGRSLKRNQTLWSAFMLQTGNIKLFLGGDSGYAHHFKDIGKQYGPFNFALLECGQYNAAWHNIHMMPEEAVQASVDLKAGVMMPVHWAKFTLALHAWDDPINRATAKAAALGVTITTPRIGEPVIIGEQYPTESWWKL